MKGPSSGEACCRRLLGLLLSFVCVRSFAPSSFSRRTFRIGGGGSNLLRALSNNDEDGTEGTPRTETIRGAIQSKSLTTPDGGEVTTPSPSRRPKVDIASGVLRDLPIFQTEYCVEVPGSASCFEVSEARYIRMFENIVNSPKPWYFGHHQRPLDDRKNCNSHGLTTWREQIHFRRGKEESSSAIDAPGITCPIGALMRISDYRRLDDGRIVLLAHALERFVVDRVVQVSFPYSVVDVQVLPDTEELPAGIMDERLGRSARGLAVERSLLYQTYEFADVLLPLPADDKHYLPSDAIDETCIAAVLPFARYSDDDSSLSTIIEEEELFSSSNSFKQSRPHSLVPEILFEHQLEGWRILQNPPSLENEGSSIPFIQCVTETADLNHLEDRLWRSVSNFVQKTGMFIAPEIESLKPPHLQRLSVTPPYATRQHDEGRNGIQVLSDRYPAYRRQRRLSYALLSVLEDTDLGVGMRQACLKAPGTRVRLAALLERFEQLNWDVGAFE